jgi:azurin
MTSFHRLRIVALVLAFPFIATGARAMADETFSISANDQMKFDSTDLAGKVGQKITITLTNDGSLPKVVMAHNIVVLAPGTDVAAFLAAANKNAAGGYLPEGEEASHIVAHTKLLGPGEDDTISFTPKVPGVYEYVCTFVGHAAAGMRGKIVVQ